MAFLGGKKCFCFTPSWFSYAEYCGLPRGGNACQAPSLTPIESLELLPTVATGRKWEGFLKSLLKMNKMHKKIQRMAIACAAKPHSHLYQNTQRCQQTSAGDGLIPENTPHCHLTGASHHAFFVRLRLIFYRFQRNKRLTELPRTLFLIYFTQHLPFPFRLKRCHGLCFARHNLRNIFFLSFNRVFLFQEAVCAVSARNSTSARDKYDYSGFVGH